MKRLINKNKKIFDFLAQAPPSAGVIPPSSASPPSSTSTPPPVFNFTPFNPASTQTSVPQPSITIPQMPFGSFPMVLPPFGTRVILLVVGLKSIISILFF